MFLEIITLSSLEKVFLEKNLSASEVLKSGSMFKNEIYSFQVAYKLHSNGHRRVPCKVEIESELTDFIQVNTVGLVPSEFPCHPDADENYLRKEPGLFPDPLYELQDQTLYLVEEYWRSLWIRVKPSEEVLPGTYPIKILFKTEEEILNSIVFEVTILNAKLPKQKLIHTEWFHSDCIADYYKVKVFSEEHWNLMKKFIKMATEYGINMILTPVFTPPLDTAIGGERTTVQLVKVIKDKDKYTFDFSLLERWIQMCQRCGVEYFEIAHLFTQWGAKHAPKIMGYEQGTYKQLFGWETDATGEEYQGFLQQFFMHLLPVIEKYKLQDYCYFHISDEPRQEHLENYKAAVANVEEVLEGYPIIDALSNYDFYKNKIVKRPIPANNHIEPFLENKVPHLWTYYCCSQYKEVSNRFFAMPSARNRIIGVQLYKYNIVGFLHWGYNFWNAQFSAFSINPFQVTDCDRAFPSGDPFLVYPGKNGPIPSIRLLVFHEALQDLRAMQYLETLKGKEFVIQLIEEGLSEEITFKQYPKETQYLLKLREKINKGIMKNI